MFVSVHAHVFLCVYEICIAQFETPAITTATTTTKIVNNLFVYRHAFRLT